MKIAGYVRQTPGRTDPDTAFAQSERIRRWVLDTGNELVAMCQDHHMSTAPNERPGFRALIDIARSAGVDAVVVGNLSALSPDKMTQEIMIQDIRLSGTTVIATDEGDMETLGSSEGDLSRMVVRDVLARVAEYRHAFGLSGDEGPTVMPAEIAPIQDERVQAESVKTTDVVVELIPHRAQAVE